MSSLRLVPGSGNPIEVMRESSLVGRDPGCDIVLSDGSVSRRHARLERRGGAFWVVDQGSANGTYINSQRVAEAALRAGQELRFGALAFRVDIEEEPGATIAAPAVGADAEKTVLASAETPALAYPSPPRIPTPPIPSGAPATPPIPAPRAAAPPRTSAPPAPPSAAAARERFRPGGAPAAPSPVPQMPGGPPPPKTGKGPLFWIGIGCCGCLLLVALFAGLLGGGIFFMTKGASDAVHARLAEVRRGDTAVAYQALSEAYRARVSQAEFEDLVASHPGLRENKDATFWQRSIDNDRAVLRGILQPRSGPPEPVTIRLVRQGRWLIDDIQFGEGE